jgi:hypothetical protein
LVLAHVGEGHSPNCDAGIAHHCAVPTGCI